MNHDLRILILEDVPEDAELVAQELKRAGIAFTARRVETRDTFLRELTDFAPDIVLSDYSLPQFNGMEALELVKERFSAIPLIIVTGSISEEVAVECIKNGATDYLIKDHLERLGVAVKAALEDKKRREQIVRAQKTIQRAAREWKGTFDAIGDAVCVLDSEGKIERCNRALLDLAKMSFQEVIGRSCCELLHGVPIPIEGCPFVRMKETLHRETQVFENKGQWFRVTADPVFDEEDTLIGCVHIVTDITSAKKQEEALRESEAKYRALFEQSRDAILLNNLEGVIVDANQAAQDLFGYTGEELQGMPVISVHSDTQALNEVFKKTKEQGFIRNYETRMRRKDGTEIDCLLDVVLRRDETGKAIGYQGSVRDITAQKQLQALLLQVQKMEAIGRLSGGIAHDFNNLLTVVRGNAEMAMKKLKKEDPLQKILTPIHEASLKAAGLTSQLLLFSRKLPLERKPLVVNVVLEEGLPLLQRLIGEDIEVCLDLAPSPWPILADRGRLEQVIMNLAGNARDAMPRGGRLNFKTENVSIDENHCKRHQDARPGKFLCLSVTDTGVGIDDEIITKIFEPFFTTKEPEKSTGLGLAVVYGVLKDHGGWVNVYSKVGIGTTFRIYLPAHLETTRGEAVQDGSAEALPATAHKVLIVEDEKALLALAEMVLTEGGYRVATAQSAEEAIAVFERANGDFDLVFTDVVLPRKNGLELLAELRAQKPSIRVLLSSGYTDEKSMWPIIQKKGYPMLHKPYPIADLLKAVKDVLGGNS
jgi:two-component system, cell cycle sensor histidine kinase and response regulator CckA